MTRVHLDANVVLRFLRNDDPRQSPAAKRLIAAAQAGDATLVLSTVTVAEVFYALRASYKLSRVGASTILKTLFESSVFELEHEDRVFDALDRVTRHNVDFGDAYLAATAAAATEHVATFDSDFKSFSNVKLYEL